MGMLYSAQFDGVAMTAVQDLFELLVPADCVVLIHYIEITQTTEAGDAAEEFLKIKLRRGVGSTSGSGGSTPALIPLESGFAAAGSVVEANNTTQMTSGTITIMHNSSWNVRTPWILLPTPELRPVLSPSQKFTVGLETAPADSITANGVIWFEEIGG